MIRYLSTLVLVLAAFPALAADGAVSGHVVVNGKPLDEGRILFHLRGGQFVGSKVKDGAYRIDRVPEGAWTVTVEGKDVPAKHSSETTSALKVTIKDGTLRATLRPFDPNEK